MKSRRWMVCTLAVIGGCAIGACIGEQEFSDGVRIGPEVVISRGAPDPPKLIVLYVFDALRADHVGERGWTPVLDRLAAEGADFTDFLSVAPSTMTAMKALFAGRVFLEPGGLPAKVETIAEVMRGAGYRTVGLSGNGHVSEKYGMTRGFDSFEMVFPRARRADPATYVNRNAAEIHARALELLGAGPLTEPTFLYLHTIHPHTPYAPPHELRDEMCAEIPSVIDGMSPTLLAIRDGKIEASEADRRRLACLYAAGLSYNDTELGAFVDELDRMAPPNEVLLVATSDHGEEFFDHGGVLHGHTLYDELIRVPLILHWPGRVPPSQPSFASDFLDLHETLRALVDASRSSAQAEGRSLWPLLTGGDNASITSRSRFAAVPTLPGGMFMVRSATHKLVLAPRKDGGPGMGLGIGRTSEPEYLFDLVSDPGETRNLIGQGMAEEATLRRSLERWIEANSNAPPPKEVELDQETKEHLEALGYVQ